MFKSSVISGMLHSLAGPTASASLGGQLKKKLVDSDRLQLSSSSVNWFSGDTVFQVPYLENITSDVLHRWEQSLAIKPAVLTTDLTLVPIYEIVDDEGVFASQISIIHI